jgi:hypothetical protein
MRRLKIMVQGALAKLGWMVHRGHSASETAALSAELQALTQKYNEACRDRDGFRESYLRYEAEIGQSRLDAEGYKAAWSEASTELSRFRSLLREAPAPVGRPRQLVFLHIQKTGGISLLDFLGRHFDWYRTLWVFSPVEFDEYAPSEIAHFDRVCGHLTARNLAAVRPDAFLCTVVREPIDRLISCYWYFRTFRVRMRESVRHAVESARGKTFLEFLRDPAPEVRRHLFNHQAHALAGDWAAPDARPDDELAAAAIAALERFDSVWLTDGFDAGVERLCSQFGWQSPGRIPVLNRTDARPAALELTPEELDEARRLTVADEQVYQTARALVNKRAASPSTF